MFTPASKVVVGVAALGALALGGSTLANAANNDSGSSKGSSSQGQPAQARGQRPPGPPPGPHVGKNGQREKPLSGETAGKVKEAALAKVKGGTVERVETDVDHGSPYEAHVRRSDGTELEVLVNKSFEVTDVNSMPQMPR